MTKEDFNLLKIGDTFQLGDVKYVITEICRDNKFTGFSGSNIETKRFVHCGIKSDCISISYVCGGSNITTCFATSYHMKDIILNNVDKIKSLESQLEEKKSEVIKLENDLKELKQKKLNEQFDNLIVDEFYTVVLDRLTFTKLYKGKSPNNQNRLIFDNGEFLSMDYISLSEIKKIIHRPELTKKYDEFKTLQYICNKNTKEQ